MGETTILKLPLCVNLQGNYIYIYIYIYAKIYIQTSQAQDTQFSSGKPSWCEKEKTTGP
jgi:hypothetical protein